MLAGLNLDPDETLSDLDKSKITEMLGIGAFVKRPPCQRGLGIHNAVNGQWNKGLFFILLPQKSLNSFGVRDYGLFEKKIIM